MHPTRPCPHTDRLTPPQIANLLLHWLGALPEPLFPAHLVPELVESQQSDYYEERLAAVRRLLKQVRACLGAHWEGAAGCGGWTPSPQQAGLQLHAAA